MRELQQISNATYSGMVQCKRKDKGRLVFSSVSATRFHTRCLSFRRNVKVLREIRNVESVCMVLRCRLGDIFWPLAIQGMVAPRRAAAGTHAGRALPIHCLRRRRQHPVTSTGQLLPSLSLSGMAVSAACSLI